MSAMRSGAAIVGALLRRNSLAIALGCLMLALVLGAPPAWAKRQSEPGRYDYLTLVLSWSPSYCAERGSQDREHKKASRKDRAGRDRAGRDALQCAAQRPYAFVLHGLWPQFQRGWPANCRTQERPWVPRQVIDGMLDIMPSPRLVIHEFRKHGVCSGLDAKDYFALARTLYESLQIPERFRAPDEFISTTAQALEADFLAANPQLTAEGIAVVCGRRGRLREIRLCFARDGAPMSCGENESQSRLCSQGKIHLPPAR